MNEPAPSLSASQVVRPRPRFADDEVPFCPSGNLATKLNNIPRYLFRVYSEKSQGENSTACMKSPDALKNNLRDVFARHDAANVAVVLNEHLRWWSKRESCADPFISWTTSLLLAIEHIIFKHKKEEVELETIHLCIVDTNEFPKGVFIRDLDLMEQFNDKVPNSQSIQDRLYTWKERGLDNLLDLRKKKAENCSGVYYFGEFLSQGQTYIGGSSSTVTCDKIVNDDLFTMVPQFKVDYMSKDKKPRWAKAVVKFRESFYADVEPEPTSASEFCKAMTIASQFGTVWFLPVLANLLALRPRREKDPGILGRISILFSDELKRSLSFINTREVDDENIPEVQQFKKIVHDINQDCRVDSVLALLRSVKETEELVSRLTTIVL